VSEQTETQELPSPTACQKCGADAKGQIGMQLQREDGKKVYRACMCDDCTMKFFGLEWRETKAQSPIIIPSVSPGARLA